MVSTTAMAFSIATALLTAMASTTPMVLLTAMALSIVTVVKIPYSISRNFPTRYAGIGHLLIANIVLGAKWITAVEGLSKLDSYNLFLIIPFRLVYNLART